MTSLGSYGTATVLECDTLLCNNIKNTNNGLVTSVYGQLKLPSDETISNASTQPLLTWIKDPSSEVVGVTIDNTNGHITLSETGLYMINSNTIFATTGHGSQSQARIRLNIFGGASSFIHTARYLANGSINKNMSLCMTHLLKLNDIRDSIEIDVFNTGPSPSVLDDGTFIQIVKIL